MQTECTISIYISQQFPGGVRTYSASAFQDGNLGGKTILIKTAVNTAKRATLTNSSANTDANNVKEWLGFLLGLANAERCFAKQV